MKTKVWMLGKNREAKELKINAHKGALKYRRDLYVVDPDHINNFHGSELHKGSEIFFFEGNSAPIPIKEEKDDKGEIKDPTTEYLDKFLLANILDQTGSFPSEKLQAFVDIIKPISSPANFFLLIFFSLVVFFIIVGILRGGTLI